VVIGVTAVGTLLGVAVARRIAPTFAARATLWVDVQDVRLRDTGPIQSGGQLMGPTGWIDLLKSRVVTGTVVRDLRLYLSLASAVDSGAFRTFVLPTTAASGSYQLDVGPAGRQFVLTSENGTVIERDKIGAPIGKSLGWEWTPTAADLTPRRTILFRVIAPEAAADRLAASIRVKTDMEGKVGNFLRIELRGPSPEGIAAVTNAVADRFVAVAADLKKEKLIELTRILEAQMIQSRNNLADAEAALRRFRVANAPELARSGAGVMRDPAAGAMFDLQGTRDQVRRDRQTIERLLSEAADGPLSVEGLGMIGSVARSAELSQALGELNRKQMELRALRYRYTDQHLPVQQLAREVDELARREIPLLARGLVAQLSAREGELARQVDSAGNSLRAIPPVALEQARLERNLQVAEVLFTGIQQRYQEARLAEVSSLPEVRVLDRAVRPYQAVYNAKTLVVALAFLSSLAIGLIGAVLLDQVDPRLRDPEEVTRRMGLPILGAVPHAGGNGTRAAMAQAVSAGNRLISAVRSSRLAGALRGRALPPGTPAEAAANGAPDGAAARRGATASRILGSLEALASKVAPFANFGGQRAEEAMNQAVEALRGIRLNLAHAYGSAGPLLVTVTSPGRGDGKSFVSSNLALAFADAGHRVLLIDGDIRRGALHRVLGARRQPGLIDFLSGDADRAAVIQETDYSRLAFIGCGTRVHHGPELLGSPSMQRFMAELRAAYEVIVVDSPPLAAGIDAFILGTLTGNLALVLRAGVTDRQLAEAKLDALERLPIRLLGAIVNDVPAQGAYRYYSYYLSGYEVEEDAPAGTSAPTTTDVG
jgi:capsular exopolysaccharide synthesis family protein